MTFHIPQSDLLLAHQYAIKGVIPRSELSLMANKAMVVSQASEAGFSRLRLW